MIKPILTVPDPRLRNICKDITTWNNESKAILADLIDTLKSTKNGIGLAAPQIGVSYNIFIMYDKNNGLVKPYINPFIEWKNKTKIPFPEQCLSIPGQTVTIKRPTEIIMSSIDPIRWERKSERLSGLTAIVAQHEYDHLLSVLITDYIRTDNV